MVRDDAPKGSNIQDPGGIFSVSQDLDTSSCNGGKNLANGPRFVEGLPGMKAREPDKYHLLSGSITNSDKKVKQKPLAYVW
jgi:hypothetical protein